jgi:hypothetical protein
MESCNLPAIVAYIDYRGAGVLRTRKENLEMGIIESIISILGGIFGLVVSLIGGIIGLVGGILGGIGCLIGGLLLVVLACPLVLLLVLLF